jgi:transforming growth factor-beta-induced protein
MIEFLKPKLLIITIVSFALFFVKACGDDDPASSVEPDPEPEETLVDVLAGSDNYSTLVSLVPDNLLSDLQNEELTIFAPTNAAFEAIPSDVLEGLTEDQIVEILTYHLVAGTTLASDIPAQTDVESLQGELLLLQSDNGVFVNGSTEVVEADLTADNGVVHGINQVLLPSDIRKALGETNIVDVAEEAGGFETLLGALETTGLKTTLQFLEPFTVFAPNDEAFAALPEGTIESLTEEQLTQILTYHAIDGEIFAGDLEPQQTPSSLNGEELYISAENGSVTVNGNSNVVSADIEATNGVIHAVDAVLLPDAFGTIVDNASKRFDYSTLVSLIPDELITVLQEQELTLFAPTNAAFESIPDDVLASLTDAQIELILTYHLVAGTTLAGDIPAQADVESLQGELLLLQSVNPVFVNGSTEVIEEDISASNGVIHGIDQVLLPSDIRKALGETNIIDVAEEAGGFETLLGALEATGLKTTLQFLEPFTVFAPNDGAFAALPEGTIESLTADQLTQILTYHVIDSEIFSGDLGHRQSPASLNGEALFIEGDGGVRINGNSEVVAADIEATNGVIHAVDRVLLPDAFGTVVDNAIKRFDFNTLVNAVVDAGLADALQAEGPFTVFAPTDDAFDALPDGLLASLSTEDLQEILLYHVIGADIKSGDLEMQQSPSALSEEALYITANGDVVVNGRSTVVSADVDASNGTIHAVDQVLLPNRFVNVVQIAQKNFDLTTLVNLVVDAELAGTLSGDGPFTIFAPVNSAFDEISDTLEGLSGEEVADVLTYHVVPDLIKSSDIPSGTTEIATVNGAEITVVNEDGTVTVNGSNVITVDLAGTNGVIHLIDAVLLP